jgi:hypothetical protein
MGSKFGLNYVLKATSNIGSRVVTITPPFTLQFDVMRSVNGSQNKATLTIIGLGRETRNELLKDFFDYSIDRTVTLQAGYGNAQNLPTIFFGTIFRSYSQLRGTTFNTEIFGQTGAFAVPKVYYNGAPFPAGTSDRVVIQALANFLAVQGGLNLGFIGNFPNTSQRSRSYDKPVYDLLQELSGNGVFIDNNKINVMNNGESIPTSKPVLINSSMGLLQTPAREQSNMIIPIIFTPEIDPGGLINLQSQTIETVQSTSTQKNNYNGLQKVNSVHHYGIISGAVSGETVTEIGITFGIPAVAQ